MYMQHRERLGSIKALDVSKINRKLAVTPDDVQLETIPDDAESGAGTGFSTMARPTLGALSSFLCPRVVVSDHLYGWLKIRR